MNIVNLYRILLMQEKKKEPKKHHYVQQSYLKGFQYGNKKIPQIVVFIKDEPLKEPLR